jgi:hypothetical protein
MTGPVPEGAMECARLRKPEQEGNLLDGETAFGQVAHGKFVTNLADPGLGLIDPEPTVLRQQHWSVRSAW